MSVSLVKMSWLTGRTFQVKQRKAKTTGTLRANKAKRHSEDTIVHCILAIQYSMNVILIYYTVHSIIYCTLPCAFQLRAQTSVALQV